jgi:hypothetical protein
MAAESAARTVRGVRGTRGLPRRVRLARRLGRELPPARCGVAWIPRLEVPGADGVTLLTHATWRPGRHMAAARPGT